MQQTTLIALVVLVVVLFIVLAIFWRVLRNISTKSAPIPAPPPLPGNKSQPGGSSTQGVVFTASQSSGLLICREGADLGKKYKIKLSGETLGRSTENSIPIDGVLVSRNHAEIIVTNGRYLLRDRSSMNGTYVNGARIYEYILNNGDSIQIGKSVFVFQEAGASSRPPVESSPPSVAVSVPSAAEIAQGLRSYQITGTIGKGMSAIVYKGVSAVNHAPVAIKILNSVDDYIRAKFEDEGKIGLRLKHPHIVETYQCGEEGGTFFIVMEYVDGGSLRERLKEGTPAPFDFVQSVIGETCEALAYSHKRGIIHRDVKPENIMLSTRNGVKVVDFGIAKLTSRSTVTTEGKLIGTPYYIPYEQAAGEEVKPASDIYSLGVILYEMLTGTWPFTGAPLVVIEKHLTEKPVPPRQINSQISPRIETVVMRALDKDIGRRYQNAMDLARDLGYQSGKAMNVSEYDGLRTIPPMPGNLGKSIAPRLPSSSNIGAPRLVVFAGGGDGKQFPLDQAIVSLHRENVNFNDGLMSRGHHCRVTIRSGQYWLEDDDSTNGTFLNGQRLHAPAALKPGDVVQIGNAMLRFVA